MYRDLKRQYWWKGMKEDVATFVAKYLTCQQIKAEHQRPAGLLQPLPIPEWKWDKITMDFVTSLPKTLRKNDAVWMIVNRLTKSTHFIQIRMDYSLTKLSRLYVENIIRLHGAPSSIVSDRDPMFTSKFWKTGAPQREVLLRIKPLDSRSSNCSLNSSISAGTMR
ncbi:Ribonuclease H-like domain containing protein [Parasponia andersonii]|uniref:Ribonuclease H-like domain containing protein n=1 Tax=Parasponia andersonii TaxID=3476 RepID=A0A2P5DW42_PARAD|nr:Ribonuclease H-like domain containing protein [Parasponia andersonii]